MIPHLGQDQEFDSEEKQGRDRSRREDANSKGHAYMATTLQNT